MFGYGIRDPRLELSRIGVVRTDRISGMHVERDLDGDRFVSIGDSTTCKIPIIHVYIYIYIYVYMYVNEYAYMYTHIHMLIHTYTYIHSHI